MLRIEGIGNLTRDPETRNIQKGENGGKVCNFTVAAYLLHNENVESCRPKM